ncbi:helix-turn-helix domain-containing protein [Paracrocinitomix mangrovi]|uniref:helix-turn-helix domain-containing protein n=1 Tax=Paracrocinitomix mangrovi TaxID=2862509 RepID=UPI001C8E3286|nr:helix-turn-helix domain-containing protein [Paracrocinitomix mangrovi]UKN02229.1 helix-turn-helix domain-containing protein [Paracrocinitomix mangrovi]
MKSVIGFDRICEWCGKKFVAHKSTTRYCCLPCNQKGYKREQREKKARENNEKVKFQSQGIDPEELKKKTYLSIKETCVYLGISRSTLYRNVRLGLLPVIGLGGRTIFKREDLDKFLDDLSTLDNN